MLFVSIRKTKAMDTIIREKQRRSGKKNEKSADPVIADVSEVSGMCFMWPGVVILMCTHWRAINFF